MAFSKSDDGKHALSDAEYALTKTRKRSILAAAKTTVWSMSGWSKIPADLADVNLDLTGVANESGK